MQDWERTGIHANRVGQEAALQGDDRHQELVLGALRNPNISGHRDKENIVACSTQLSPLAPSDDGTLVAIERASRRKAAPCQSTLRGTPAGSRAPAPPRTGHSRLGLSLDP